MTSFELNGKIAVVTGAARGIGEAISRTLAKNGASVFLVDVLADEVKNVASELTSTYPNARFSSVNVDLSQSAEIGRLVEHYKKEFCQSPDIVVNNAAICKVSEWTDTTEEDFDKQIAINLKAVHLVSLHFSRMAIEQKRKQSIINISSFTTYAGHSKLGAYVAAKSGVIGLMKVMAKELGPQGIRVNCVCPGYIYTTMSKTNTTDERFAEVAKETPMRRIGEPQDIANMVLFLASDLASFCHGSCYDVHGGLTM